MGMIYFAAVMAALCAGLGIWNWKNDYHNSAFINFVLALFWIFDIILRTR